MFDFKKNVTIERMQFSLLQQYTLPKIKMFYQKILCLFFFYFVGHFCAKIKWACWGSKSQLNNWQIRTATHKSKDRCIHSWTTIQYHPFISNPWVKCWCLIHFLSCLSSVNKLLYISLIIEGSVLSWKHGTEGLT